VTDNPETETVALLCIGGPLHGQEKEVEAGRTTWFDLASATTYYLKPMRYVERAPSSMAPTSLWEIGVLVHESLMTSDEDNRIQVETKHQAVNAMWTDVMMRAFMRDRGRQVPLTEHPDHAKQNGHRKLILPPDGGNLK